MYFVWIGLWWALIAARMISSGVKKKKKKKGWDWGKTDERVEAFNQHGWKREEKHSVYSTVASRIWSLWLCDWQAADFNYVSETNTVLKKGGRGRVKGRPAAPAAPLSFYLRFWKWRRKEALLWTMWQLACHLLTLSIGVSSWWVPGVDDVVLMTLVPAAVAKITHCSMWHFVMVSEWQNYRYSL